MSDTEKPKPESLSEAIAGVEDAPVAGASNVISIDQARAELLRRSKSSRATPPRGTGARRARSREVPAPVTLAPGEHDSVIVADTPAARAHIERRTVRPGETPNQTHDKKIRLKTSIDPRRQKTQVTERRAAPEPAAPPPEAAPQSARQSAPPASQRPSSPVLTRPRPLPPPSRGAPLFTIGIAVAAALGAVLVYTLLRPRPNTVAPPAPTVTAAPPRSDTPPSTATPAPPPPPSTTASATVEPLPPATATAAPATEPAATASAAATAPTATGAAASSTASVTAAASPSPPRTAKTSAPAAPSPKQTSTGAPSLTPTAPAKPTTNVLPFGKEEN